MIQIKNRLGNVIYTDEKAETIADAIRSAYLRGADLSGADLSGAYLSGADLSGAYLSGADLSGAYLSRAYLSGAYLSGAYLRGADLSGADLRGADLSRAYLSRAYLSGADLRGADLSRAYLSRAYLSGADLSGAYLSRADLSGALGLPFDLEAMRAAAPALRLKVAEHIEAHPELHDQSDWGDGKADPACETACCVAGWACHLGGGDRGLGVETAARLLLHVDGKPMPDFDASTPREEILEDLRA